MKKLFKIFVLITISSILISGFYGCSKKQVENSGNSNLSGEIKIDGSSTVYPITEAVAEEFRNNYPNVQVTVGISGTGGGFKKFLSKETDINDASRAITDEEKQTAQKNNIEFTEFTIGYDGISIVVNKENTWVDSLTIEQLKKMWISDSKIKSWKDINPNWPDSPIKFYSPGADSGTFDYFTEDICGKKGAIRKDINPSENDDVLVQGVAGDKNAIAFFGLAYYEENMDKLKIVKIDGGNGPVEPNIDTVKSKQYPLSRPLYIYVNNQSLKRPEVYQFVKFYLSQGKDLIEEVGYISLSDQEYTKQLEKIK